MSLHAGDLARLWCYGFVPGLPSTRVPSKGKERVEGGLQAFSTNPVLLHIGMSPRVELTKSIQFSHWFQ